MNDYKPLSNIMMSYVTSLVFLYVCFNRVSLGVALSNLVLNRLDNRTKYFCEHLGL